MTDAERTALVARRDVLLAKIRELRGQVADIDKRINAGDARTGLARRLANLTPAERDLLNELTLTDNLDKMGLRNKDGTVRKRPR